MHGGGERGRSGVAGELALGQHHLTQPGAQAAELGGYGQPQVSVVPHRLVALGDEGGVQVVPRLCQGAFPSYFGGQRDDAGIVQGLVHRESHGSTLERPGARL